jgi:hypothetical protein
MVYGLSARGACGAKFARWLHGIYTRICALYNVLHAFHMTVVLIRTSNDMPLALHRTCSVYLCWLPWFRPWRTPRLSPPFGSREGMLIWPVKPRITSANESPGFCNLFFCLHIPSGRHLPCVLSSEDVSHTSGSSPSRTSMVLLFARSQDGCLQQASQQLAR